MIQFLSETIPHEWFHSFAIILIGLLMSATGWLGARTLKMLVDADIALKKAIDDHVRKDDKQFELLASKIEHLAEKNSSEHQSIIEFVAKNNMILKNGR